MVKSWSSVRSVQIAVAIKVAAPGGAVLTELQHVRSVFRQRAQENLGIIVVQVHIQECSARVEFE